MDRVDAILTFWFGDPQDETSEYGQMRQVWFQKSAEFDQTIRHQFLADYQAAAAGNLDHWRQSPRPCLALVLLYDQFSRNLFRGQAASYGTDPQALMTARYALEQGFEAHLLPVERVFLYLPFEHSENLADQQLSVQRFEALVAQYPEMQSYLTYAVKHQEVVQRFGRFPHRNQALGRLTTPAEARFLAQPGSRF